MIENTIDGNLSPEELTKTKLRELEGVENKTHEQWEETLRLSQRLDILSGMVFRKTIGAGRALILTERRNK
jgi:hypothetical protein